ncbi:peroxisomal biogenesis factor 3 [Chrysochromulina tobinii]|uniref:Peroxisomal biogenesis factor 3 n=1 Tax=Chrysochromulina tobinii TaxID=1460289 RepID=A0A0M0JAE5_9EUKA|nr:peroxisomal biogenesis factor 3 [Chrysochromulina tobinii]|eukprot:KOO23337.1 peroxisomal biogenesis factor 3 [Chrysochromulina sp. CCMP291]
MLNWAWRHKRKIVATAVVGGATAYGVYYLYRKKRELDELVESLGLNELLYGGSANSSGARSSATQEERVREHFDDTQREADRLLCEALPRLQEQIAGLIMTDALQERLRAEGPSAEPAGWHELKVLVVSRLLTAQYALVLTVLAIRIRLNIIGRHYLNEAQAAADGTRLDGALSKLTKKRFLSLERWLAEGLQPLEQQVTACVRAHLASEAAANTSKESFFSALCTTQLQELLDEVRTLVGSNAFRITLEKLLEVTFATVGEQLQQAIGGGNGCGAATGTVPKRAGTVLTRAKLLPKYKQLSTATLAAHEPYAAALLEVPSLQDFCWQVYLGE